MQKKEIIYLNFYDIRVSLSSNSQEILEELKRDFSYFLSNTNTPEIKIEIFHQSLPYELIPQIKASLYLPRAMVYDYKHTTRYVDYNGQVLTIYNYDKEEGCLYSEDKSLLHEISYLLILSRVGELLDRRGIHRIHGLGISIDGKAILCLLPMGAGKTTLALDLLKNERLKLISDDIVLISKEGKILPFPLRIGIDKKINLDIPAEFLREFHRMQYGPKTLIDIEYFKEKISDISIPWIIFIGEREFSNQARIEPLSKMKTIKSFITNGVIGLGLPQIVEYFLRSSLKDLINKINIVLLRLFVSLKVILKSKAYRFVIGRNRDRNIEVLLDFLKNNTLL